MLSVLVLVAFREVKHGPFLCLFARNSLKPVNAGVTDALTYARFCMRIRFLLRHFINVLTRKTIYIYFKMFGLHLHLPFRRKTNLFLWNALRSHRLKLFGKLNLLLITKKVTSHVGDMQWRTTYHFFWQIALFFPYEQLLENNVQTFREKKGISRKKQENAVLWYNRRLPTRMYTLLCQ